VAAGEPGIGAMCEVPASKIPLSGPTRGDAAGSGAESSARPQADSAAARTADPISAAGPCWRRTSAALAVADGRFQFVESRLVAAEGPHVLERRVAIRPPGGQEVEPADASPPGGELDRVARALRLRQIDFIEELQLVARARHLVERSIDLREHTLERRLTVRLGPLDLGAGAGDLPLIAVEHADRHADADTKGIVAA